MATQAHLDCDVLVVGAGPTGSTLALLLARRGLKVVVVDREADIYPLPRAAHVDHEAMRIFQALGLAAEVAASSRQVTRYDFLNLEGEVLLRFDGADAVGPGGWPVSNMIHQPSIERVLREALEQEPGVTLRARWSLSSLSENGPDVVAAEFRTPTGTAQLTARFMVGADGARSTVRELAGIAVDDLGFDEPWLVVDTLVHDRSRLPEINLQICDPARPTTCVVMGSGRHRWEFMLKPDEIAEQVVDDHFVSDLLRPWDVDGAITVERKAVYRFSAKVAEAWRRGRVLLVGDAAHTMPPFAGQGLCSGLRDAANLFWKLAAVVADGAPEGRLLDTYQVEREPHVRAIIGLAMMMGRTVCLLDPEAAAARDAQMIAARSAGSTPPNRGWPPFVAGCVLAGSPAAGSYFPQPASETSETSRLDDVLGPQAWLISRHGGSPPHPALRAVTLDDAILRPFRTALDLWLEGIKSEAVLVRPDRYVFGSGDPAALTHAYLAEVVAAAPRLDPD